MQISGDTTSIIQKNIFIFGIDSTEFLKEFVKNVLLTKYPNRYDSNTILIHGLTNIYLESHAYTS